MTIKERINKFIFFIKENTNKNLYFLYKILPEVFYPIFLKKIYKDRTGHNLNLNNPRRLSEKIQWIKLYDNLPIKAMLTDKLKVRDWVKEKVSTLNFPEIYGIWDSFEEIDFELLPQAFYLKSNHGCAMNIGVKYKDRFLKEGKKEVSKTFKKWLNTNFAFEYGFELQYKNIVPKIYAEERLFAKDNERVSDYKIMCMNGKVKYIEYFVYSNPWKSKLAIYDKNWKKQPFTHSSPIYEEELPRHPKLEEMISIAETLAQGFKIVRVDLVDIENTLYFAEMTFTPCSGHMIFSPDEYDVILGDMLDLK